MDRVSWGAGTDGHTRCMLLKYQIAMSVLPAHVALDATGTPLFHAVVLGFRCGFLPCAPAVHKSQR